MNTERSEGYNTNRAMIQKEGGQPVGPPGIEMQPLNKAKALKDSIVSKSRRSKGIARDITAEGQDNEYKPPEPEYMLYGEYLFMVSQLIVILIFGLCTEFGEGVHPRERDVTNGDFSKNRDIVQKLYPVFQDVHVMIFIGFGFLMTFIKTMSWTALAYNWIISVWALQLGLLSNGFFHQVFHGGAMHKITINLENLIVGDFGAGAAMITFGVLLGKCNLQQLMILITWQMLWWGINENIGVQIYNATDAGGSMFVHSFGAYYGLAATYFFQPKRAATSNNLKSSYQSEMIAVIGAIFLWMFWPSFNGALASDITQHRIIVNTVLAISGSCLGAVFTARILLGKLDMEIVLNATLAGGVMIGSSCDMCSEPWQAMLIGLAGGILSATGFQKIGPYLADKIHLQDTCGVNSLHGMPGIAAAIISAIVVSGAGNAGFPDDYFPAAKKSQNLGDQAVAQILCIITTLVIAIFSGLTGGWMCSLSIWQPPHSLFRDDDHFHDMVSKYPPSYLVGGDETYEAAKATFDQIKGVLIQKRKEMSGDADKAIEELVEEIWEERGIDPDANMDKKQTQAFLSEYIAQLDKNVTISQDAFDQIFKLLDEDGNEAVSKREMSNFIKNFTEAQMQQS